MGQVGDWNEAIVGDGFEQRGYIAPNHGLHGELRFMFRPMLPEDYQAMELHRSMNRTDVKKVMLRARTEIASRLTSWSLVDDKGVPRPVNQEMLRKMRSELWERLYNIVCGLSKVDDDPLSVDGIDEGGIVEQLGN